MQSLLGLHHCFKNGPSLTPLHVNLFRGYLGVFGLFLELGKERTMSYSLLGDSGKATSVFGYFFFVEISSLSLAINLCVHR